MFMPAAPLEKTGPDWPRCYVRTRSEISWHVGDNGAYCYIGDHDDDNAHS